MKRSIIVTGGAGFIGSHVVRLFVNKYPEYNIITPPWSANARKAFASSLQLISTEHIWK